MSTYLYDIKIGILLFPVIAFVLSLPYALYQYRRFGSVSTWKTFVAFAFVLYLLCACCLVVLPLPADRAAVVPGARVPQLDPLYLVQCIRETTDFSLGDRTTWLATLKTPCVYEAIFNVMLTMPLGAFLCYLFRCRWYNVLLIGLATTLLFETSQLTGLFGLYEHPYRLFDVDDLILNTLGAMLGFWLAIPICWVLPRMDEVDERSQLRGLARVTALRRLAAFTLDAMATVLLFLVVWAVLSPTDLEIAKALAIDPSRAQAKGLALHMAMGLKADPVGAMLLASCAALVTFVLVPVALRGRTLGHAVVGLRIVGVTSFVKHADVGSSAHGESSGVEMGNMWLGSAESHGHGSWVEGAVASSLVAPRPAGAMAIFVRYGLLGAFAVVPLWLAVLVPESIDGVMSGSAVVQVIVLVYGIWAVSLAVRAVVSAFGGPFTMLNELMSGTRLVPSATLRAGGSRPVVQDAVLSATAEAEQRGRRGRYENREHRERYR